VKKYLAVLLTLVLFASLFNTVSAETVYSDELLVNGGFENGTMDSWSNSGNSAEVGSAYAYGGSSYGLYIRNRSGIYSTVAQDITSVLKANGQGKYVASYYAKLFDSTASATGRIVIRIQTDEEKANGSYSYYASNEVQLSSSTWTKLNYSGIVAISDVNKIDNAKIYPQILNSTTSEAPSFIVDSFSLKKATATDSGGEAIQPIDISNVEREEVSTVGAIRWDAWTTHDGVSTSVVSQVERSLSPAQFHFRAPFFATVTNEGKIEIPSYTQETFDREMEYAIEAGIDYFAYVWYNSAMKAPRVFHTTSKYRNEVKMCCIFDGNAICQTYARNEMRTLLKQDYYVKVLDGRPLMYYYYSGNLEKIATDIVYYRELAEEIGVKEPFAVILNCNVAETEAAVGDATGKYAVSGSDSEAYLSLVNRTLTDWKNAASTGEQIVPWVSMGWSAIPRYYNPVSWTTAGINSHVEYATDSEITTAVDYAFDFLNTNKYKNATKLNTMLIYAWNEHDEGGWICPTLEVDEDGNQLYDKDGTPLINKGHLLAVKEAIDKYKSGYYAGNRYLSVTNGDGELGTENWCTFSSGGGNIASADEGANGTAHSVKFNAVAGNSIYSSIGFDLGPAIIQDIENGYFGAGAGTYKISFYVKAEAGKSGTFYALLQSQKHVGANQMAEWGFNSLNSYMNMGKLINMSDEWQKVEITFSISKQWLENIYSLYNEKGFTAAYKLILRLDGSMGAYGGKASNVFGYYADEVEITSLNVRGDADGDGIVTARDRAIIARYVAQWENYDKLCNLKSADINKDGTVDKRDTELLMRYLAGYKNAEIG